MEKTVNNLNWDLLGEPGEFLSLSQCRWQSTKQYGCMHGYFRTNTPMGVEVCELTHVSFFHKGDTTRFWYRNSKDTPNENCRWR